LRIGTVEVRTTPPPPPPVRPEHPPPQPAVVPPRPPPAGPLARGLGWRFGLAQS
jgi:hypothetical protein